MLATRDLSFAFALHMLVVFFIIGLNQWRTPPIIFPEQVIQVNMVSLETLLALQKPKTEAKSSPTKKIKPKAALKPKEITKKAVKKVKVIEEELDYDPFSPMESKQNKPRKKKVSGQQALAEMLDAQLSDAEIERYKLGMQRAVERQWKVPTEMIERVNDALVELILYRNGKVAKVEIITSSGSKALDKTLIQAIYAASPFMLPKQQFERFKSNRIWFKPLK